VHGRQTRSRQIETVCGFHRAERAIEFGPNWWETSTGRHLRLFFQPFCLSKLDSPPSGWATSGPALVCGALHKWPPAARPKQQLGGALLLGCKDWRRERRRREKKQKKREETGEEED